MSNLSKIEGLVFVCSSVGEYTGLYRDGKRLYHNNNISALDLLDILQIPCEVVMFDESVELPDTYRDLDDLKDQLKPGRVKVRIETSTERLLPCIKIDRGTLSVEEKSIDADGTVYNWYFDFGPGFSLCGRAYKTIHNTNCMFAVSIDEILNIKSHHFGHSGNIIESVQNDLRKIRDLL
jgi:hypothetical protein